jgi:acyl dehydratase
MENAGLLVNPARHPEWKEKPMQPNRATGRRIMAMADEIGGKDLLYLDDLQVGQRFVSKTLLVDEAQIKAFARQFDPQPFHLDENAAKDSLFSGLVASGWHTAAMTMRLLVETGLPLAGGLIGAGGELSWPRPTRPGDILRVESEVQEIIPSRSRPDRGVVALRMVTLNQRDEEVQIFVAKLVVPRRT